MEILNNILNYVGVSDKLLIAGMIGSLLSLTYEVKPTFKSSLIAIFTGAFTAAYLTPSLVLDEKIELAIAFVFGIASMRIIGAILEIGEELRKDPFSIFSKFKQFKNGSKGSN